MDELARRREEAYNAGGKAKLEARRAKGLMTARDRIESLFDSGSFQEFGMHVQHNCHNFGMDKKVLPTDGIVSGIGLVGGRPVAAFSQDFTVSGGSLGSNHAKKIVDLMKLIFFINSAENPATWKQASSDISWNWMKLLGTNVTKS